MTMPNLRRAWLTAAGSALLIATANAQVEAHFDGLSEGGIGPLHTENGITFSELDRYLGSTSEWFVIEDASTGLVGLPGFTSPNTLGFGGYSPGGGVGFSRCGTFKITPPSAASQAELALFIAGGSTAGNIITLEARLGGALVDSDSLIIPSGFGPHPMQLSVGGATFDTLHVVGTGALHSGSFFAVMDSVIIGGGPTGTAYCFGDGTGTPCPCGNPGSPGRGCANSTASGGALLEGFGNASASASTLALVGSGAQPNQPGLYFQGDNAINAGNGIQNGDGLRCAGGSIRRLQVVLADSTGASQTTVDIAAAGLVAAGQTKRYQWWYRNPAPGAPCGTTFNLSNGLEVTWAP